MELPYRLYRNDPHWVPPLRIAVKELLDRAKHPFYANAEAEFFLARRDGEVVGRIAAIIDARTTAFTRRRRASSGFSNAINDQAVAEALLSRARQWVCERGAHVLRGPVNPSTNYECGMLMDGFDSDPMVMMTYNPPYYSCADGRSRPAQSQGLCWPTCSNANTIETKKIERVADKALTTNGVRVRPINMKDFDAEVERVWRVYKAAWSAQLGIRPHVARGISLMGKEMKQILKPDWC